MSRRSFAHGFISIAIAISFGCVFGVLPLLFLYRVKTIPPIISFVSGTIPLISLEVTSTHQAPKLDEGKPIRLIESPRVVFVGDIMLDRKVAERTKNSKNPDYVFQRLPARWFETFDYAVANLEGPVTDQRRDPQKTIDFQFDPSVLPTLQRSGIDAVSQANNHALDQGRIGYEDSVRRLRQAGILVFGDQVHDDSVALATTTISGQSFAFLGFNTTDNALDRVQAEQVIQLAHQSASHTIVYMHWGNEYTHEPTVTMQKLAHWFIDKGVTMVIGSHPHWYQGIESYKGHPIVYSLGNFVFDQEFSVETRQGLAVGFTFSEQKILIEPIPVQIDLSQPRLVEGEERVKRLHDLATLSDPGLKMQIEQGKVEFAW